MLKQIKANTSSDGRRDFLKKATLVSAGLFAGANFAYAGGKDTLRVGLVGCGSRGTGAARNCINAAENVELYAMGDLFGDRLESSRNILNQALGEKCNVPPERCHTGLEAYKQVIQSNVDLVLLAAPPAYRPSHFAEAVRCNRHVFMEKPVAVDPVGVRSILETGSKAEKKGLAVMSGLQFRKQGNYIDAVKKIHGGYIGRPLAGHAQYLTGTIWFHERTPEMTEKEWQLRNWYYYNWLSGDFIVDQFVHNLDTIVWVTGSMPVACTGTGGRQVRTAPEFGNIYDHFDLMYEFPDGLMVSASCRQMDRTYRNVSNRIVGSNATVVIAPERSVVTWPYGGERHIPRPDGDSAYVMQKKILIDSIRSSKPLNETKIVAESTLMAIMGREAAYTGQKITWDQIRDSSLELFPRYLDMVNPIHDPIALPGETRLDRVLRPPHSSK
jgi:predicted dehydrogenase